MRVFIMTVTIIFLTGCATSGLKSKTNKLSPGMDRAEVETLMGTPDDKQFNGKQEAWQYCSTGALSTDEFVVVWLDSGKVTGLSSYNQSGHFGSCTGAFRSVNWEQAPTAVLEVRNR